MNVSSFDASVFSLCAFPFVVAEGETSPRCYLVDFVLMFIIQYRISRVKVWQRPLRGFAKVAFSRACWPLSRVACGDREDFLQFLRTLPSLREGKVRRNCNRESCRGTASA